MINAAPTTTAALPLVVAVHGLGDRPEHFAGLIDGFDQPIRLILPRGPDPQGDGSSWFSVRFSEGKATVLPGEIARASDRVAGLIRALAGSRPVRGKPILLGFSQGGMISFAVAVRHPELLEVALPMAGWLPPELLPEPEQAAKIPQIVAFHGGLDRLVPFAETKTVVQELQKRGVRVELISDPKGAHEVTPALRARLFALLRRTISATQ